MHMAKANIKGVPLIKTELYLAILIGSHFFLALSVEDIGALVLTHRSA